MALSVQGMTGRRQHYTAAAPIEEEDEEDEEDKGKAKSAMGNLAGLGCL